MDTLDAMRVFVAVVERNGFSAAAQALDMSTAGVTRQIAALEKRLSTRLLNRTTRRVSPTSTGAAYYAQCVQLLAQFDALEAGIGAQALEPSGLLRVNAPVSYGIARLGPLLAGYRARYPQVQLDLSLSDRLVDMVEEGYDVAIRITRQPNPALIARKLADTHITLCAAPAYLDAHGRPQQPTTCPTTNAWATATGAAATAGNCAARAARCRCRCTAACAPTTATCCARPRWPAWASSCSRTS